jgi:hypothetical protein
LSLIKSSQGVFEFVPRLDIPYTVHAKQFFPNAQPAPQGNVLMQKLDVLVARRLISRLMLFGTDSSGISQYKSVLTLPEIDPATNPKILALQNELQPGYSPTFAQSLVSTVNVPVTEEPPPHERPTEEAPTQAPSNHEPIPMDNSAAGSGIPSRSNRRRRSSSQTEKNGIQRGGRSKTNQSGGFGEEMHWFPKYPLVNGQTTLSREKGVFSQQTTCDSRRQIQECNKPVYRCI